MAGVGQKTRKFVGMAGIRGIEHDTYSGVGARFMTVAKIAEMAACRVARLAWTRAWVRGWRQMIAVLLSVALSFAGTLFAAADVAAHGSNYPSDLRNSRNQFTRLRPQKPAPMMPILAENGSLLDLGRFRGKVVLVNFWATWCAPCIREMPALDRLQAILGDQRFTVVALSVDEGEIDQPVSFVRRLGLGNLDVYLDFTGAAAKAFPLYGLPITYLIDREGATVGYITGAVEWDSAESISFLRHYIEAD